MKVTDVKLLGILEFYEEDDDFFHVVSLLHLVTEIEDGEETVNKNAEIRFF